jgi:hypothetical protein
MEVLLVEQSKMGAVSPYMANQMEFRAQGI